MDGGESTRREVAAALVQRCTWALAESAERGGPTVDQHLEDLRRTLARRRVRHAGARARRVDAALRNGDLTSAGWLLVHDLRGVERALVQALRIGTLARAT